MTYKNIIFDLGGVVLTWRPDLILSSLFHDPVLEAKIKTAVIDSQFWIERDKGLVSDQESYRMFESYAQCSREVTLKFYEMVMTQLSLISATVDIMQRCQQARKKLYCLSNMAPTTWEYLLSQYSFWNVFSGIVTSGECHLAKPDVAIYQHLLSRYHLDPSESVFIDDLQANITAAETCGIKGLLFLSPKDCERHLTDWGVLGTL